MPENPQHPTTQADLTGMLVKATTQGNILDIQACLELGADINARDELALREAALNYQKEAVRYLCDHGADFGVAISKAAALGDLHVTQRLIELTGNETRVVRTLRAAFAGASKSNSRSKTDKAHKKRAQKSSDRFIF